MGNPSLQTALLLGALTATIAEPSQAAETVASPLKLPETTWLSVPSRWWLSAGLGAGGNGDIGGPGIIGSATAAWDHFQLRLRAGAFEEFALCFNFSNDPDHSCRRGTSLGEGGVLAGYGLANRWIAASASGGAGVSYIDNTWGPAILAEVEVLVGWQYVGLGLTGFGNAGTSGSMYGGFLMLHLGEIFAQR